MTRRSFDVARTTASDSCMIVRSSGLPGHPIFNVWDGESWSEDAPLTTTSAPTETVEWVELVAHPTSDELAVVYSDDAHHLKASVWNGTAWSDAALLEGGLRTLRWKNFAVEYESVSGDLLIVWGRASGGDGFVWSTKSAGETAFAMPSTYGGVVPPGPVALTREAGTNRVAMAYLEYAQAADGAQDLVVGTWFDGWQEVVGVDSDIGGAGYEPFPGSPPVAIASGASVAEAIATYTKSPSPGIDWATLSDGAWHRPQAATTTPALGDKAALRLLPVGDGRLMALVADAGGSLWAKAYRDGRWTDMDGGGALATGLSRVQGAAFDAANYE
jgi:hypothetical protein